MSATWSSLSELFPLSTLVSLTLAGVLFAVAWWFLFWEVLTTRTSVLLRLLILFPLTSIPAAAVFYRSNPHQARRGLGLYLGAVIVFFAGGWFGHVSERSRFHADINLLRIQGEPVSGEDLRHSWRSEKERTWSHSLLTDLWPTSQRKAVGVLASERADWRAFSPPKRSSGFIYQKETIPIMPVAFGRFHQDAMSILRGQSRDHEEFRLVAESWGLLAQTVIKHYDNHTDVFKALGEAFSRPDPSYPYRWEGESSRLLPHLAAIKGVSLSSALKLAAFGVPGITTLLWRSLILASAYAGQVGLS